MKNIIEKINLYLGREPDYINEVLIMDNDGTQFIKEWNIKDKPKPTDEQLNSFETDATKIENNITAINKREKEYGSIFSQIEFITENGLEAWQSKVQEIKTKSPKENE